MEHRYPSISWAPRQIGCVVTAAVNISSFKNVTLRALIIFHARCINKQDYNRYGILLCCLSEKIKERENIYRYHEVSEFL